MYIYSAVYGEIRRFSMISWIEWLKKWKEEGTMPNDIDKYSKHFGNLELGDMASWTMGDVNVCLDSIAERRNKKRKHESIIEKNSGRNADSPPRNHFTDKEPGKDRKDP